MRFLIYIIAGPRKGESIIVPEGGIFIGRSEEELQKLAMNQTELARFEIPVQGGAQILQYKDPGGYLSRKHAWVGYDKSDKLVVRDLGSTNHTYIGSTAEPVKSAELRSGDIVKLCKTGVVEFKVEAVSEVDRTIIAPKSGSTSVPGKQAIQLKKGVECRIGRADDNDIVLPYPQISRHHCRIFYQDDEVFVEDLRSTNGTSINGRRITRQKLSIGDVIGIGPVLLHYGAEGRISQESLANGVKFEAHEVTRKIKDKVIISGISFVSFPTEFVGIMGPSGCGKTTLLNAITGYDHKATGRVLFNGMDLYGNYDALRGNIGYVPQDDIVHRSLTVYQSLYYTAKLRMPEDTSEKEIKARVEKVIKDLGLEGIQNVRIGGPDNKGISGGERKRVNMAQELITGPTCLVLDEPISGLDPTHGQEVMNLLKKIANKGRNVIICSHDTSKHTFDTLTHVLIILDGKMVYYGPSRAVFKYFEFGGDEPEKIFLHLGGKYCPKCDISYTNASEPRETCENCKTPFYPAESWKEKFLRSDYYANYVKAKMTEHKDPTSVAPRPRRQQANPLRQWWILTRRYLRIKIADSAATAVLLLQAPIIALLLGLVFGGKEYSQMQGVLFMMAIASIWFGAINACREIVSERTVYRRERMVNLQIVPYLMSKAVVLFGFLVLQCLVLALVAKLMVRELPGSVFGYTGILALGGMAGAAMGLLISSLLSSAEGAMGLVPVILIPQVLFAGTIIKLDELGAMRFLADFMPSRWVLDALSHMSNRTNTAVAETAGWVRAMVVRGDLKPDEMFRWFDGIPSVGLGLDVLLLLLLTFVFIALAGAVLKTKDVV